MQNQTPNGSDANDALVPREELLIVELDDRFEFSVVPIDDIDEGVAGNRGCDNTASCSGDNPGCTNGIGCH